MDGFVERVWTAPDGVRLCARDYAGRAGEAGLPVLCLHGLTRNARDFEMLAPWIAGRSRRVLAFDVRGRGRSGPAADPMSYVAPTYVADVLGWTKALGIDRALVVGTSMGGVIAMALAATAPDLIGGSVLNDIGPEIGARGLARIASYVGDAVAPANWQEAADYARAINATAFPEYGPAQWAAFARRLFREDAGRLSLDYDPAIAQAFRSPPTEPAPDLWPLFDALADGGPLVVVRGETSDILEAKTAVAMAARRPSVVRAEVPGRGHAPALDEPHALAAIERWLAETP